MEDIRIYVETDDAENIYKNIRTEFFTKNYFTNNIEIFSMAVMIGKYILNKREPLQSRKSFIRYESIENSNEMDIFKCIAIEETEDVTVINNIKEIYEICEEYANAGIKELKKWVVNEDTFQNKLSEYLIEFNEQNKIYSSKYQNK